MTETTQQILRHEGQLIDAKRALDIGVLDRLYADDLLMSGVIGQPTCSKTTIIDEVNRRIAQRESAAAAGGPPASVENEDMHVAAYGDTAIANHRFVVKGRARTSPSSAVIVSRTCRRGDPAAP